MNAKDLQQLQDYLVKLTHVGYVKRDPQAAEVIAAAFSLQIDAPYLAVQRCLQLESALAEAYAKIARLEQITQREPIDPLDQRPHAPTLNMACAHDSSLAAMR